MHAGCEAGAAGKIHSGWESMQPVLGTVPLPIQACVSMSLFDPAPWPCFTDREVCFSGILFFFFKKIHFSQTDLENEVSLLVVEAVGWHSLGTSGVSFLDMWGLPFTWRE